MRSPNIGQRDNKKKTSIAQKENEYIIKKLCQKCSLPKHFIGEYYKIFKSKIIFMLFKYFQAKERKFL